MAEPVLAGRRVLVVEDQFVIADEIAAALRGWGARVLGPAPDVATARALLAEGAPDCAVLDVNLKGERVFELAAELASAGTPFVFATGYDDMMIPEAFSDRPRFEKPIDLAALADAVRRACGGEDV